MAKTIEQEILEKLDNTLLKIDNILNNSVGNAFVSIDYNHNEVHSGRAYKLNSYTGSVSNNGTFSVLLKLGATYNFHYNYLFQAIGTWKLDVYKNPTITADGTAIDITKLNHNIIIEPELTAFYTPTANGGTLIETAYSVAGQTAQTRAASDIRNNYESVYKRGENYLFVLTNLSGATNQADLMFEGYETTR